MLQLATMVLEKAAERALVTGLRRREQGRLVGRRVRDRVCHRFVAGLNGHDVSTSSVGALGWPRRRSLSDDAANPVFRDPVPGECD